MYWAFIHMPPTANHFSLGFTALSLRPELARITPKSDFISRARTILANFPAYDRVLNENLGDTVVSVPGASHRRTECLSLRRVPTLNP